MAAAPHAVSPKAAAGPARRGAMPVWRRWLRHNGLSLALAALFLGTLFGGQFFAGRAAHNEERRQRGEAPLGPVAYLRSAHFAEATTENWESEFLQMFVYVWLTAFLVQKGSAESNPLDGPGDSSSGRWRRAEMPWPVRRGGWWRKVYEHSLSLALMGLFLVSFAGHVASSTRLANEERVFHGEPALNAAQHMGTAEFWFESFQNWQSEFLAIGSMVVLSIFLREKNSPESKPVEAPHHVTG